VLSGECVLATRAASSAFARFVVSGRNVSRHASGRVCKPFAGNLFDLEAALQRLLAVDSRGSTTAGQSGLREFTPIIDA
jgi:hypothetical protein